MEMYIGSNLLHLLHHSPQFNGNFYIALSSEWHVQLSSGSVCWEFYCPCFAELCAVFPSGLFVAVSFSFMQRKLEKSCGDLWFHLVSH